MNLRHTILGLLSQKPASGYDLKRIISDSEVFYWSGNNNQIYKTLIELQNEGLVTHQTQIQVKLPNKKIFSITEKGSAELYSGLKQPVELPEVHKDILILLTFADQLSDQELLTLLKKYEAELSIRLKMCEHQAAQQKNPPARSKREAFLWQRIADNLTADYQSEIEWVRQIMDGLSKNGEGKTKKRSK